MSMSRFVYTARDIAGLEVIAHKPFEDGGECGVIRDTGRHEAGGGDPWHTEGKSEGGGGGSPGGNDRSGTMAGAMATAIKEQGGFTFEPHTASVPKEGYAVGGFDGLPQYDATTFSRADAEKFLTSNKYLLDSGAYHVGGWVDKGKVYLDVTAVFSSKARAAAIKAAKKNNQISIADMKALNEGRFGDAFIPTGGTGMAKDVKKGPVSRVPAGADRRNAYRDGEDYPRGEGTFLLFDGDVSADELYSAIQAKVAVEPKAAK